MSPPRPLRQILRRERMSASRASLAEVAVAHSKQCGCPIATCLSRLHFHFGRPARERQHPSSSPANAF